MTCEFGCGVSEPRNFTRIARETPLKVLRSNAHANYFRLKARQIQEHLNGLPVHRNKFGCSTSELGQKQTLDCRPLMSALPPKADIAGCELDVRFVPKADIVSPCRRKDYVPAPGIKQRIWVLP
jgi:hypothetical protein